MDNTFSFYKCTANVEIRSILQAIPTFQIPPPIPHHPPIKVRNLQCAPRLHDEIRHPCRRPVVEVVQRIRVAHLMEQNVDVLRVEIAHEILLSDPLAPVTARAAGKPIGQPERDVVVP